MFGLLQGLFPGGFSCPDDSCLSTLEESGCGSAVRGRFGLPCCPRCAGGRPRTAYERAPLLARCQCAFACGGSASCVFISCFKSVRQPLPWTRDDGGRTLKVKEKSESEIVMISSCCHVALMVNIWKNVMSLLNQHLRYLSLFQGCACIILYPCRRKSEFLRLQLKLI